MPPKVCLARLRGTALVVVLGLAASVGLVRSGAASADGWRLDVNRALDAIGVSAGMTVGEAGAGDGYFTLPMARRVGPAGTVYANDIDRRALGSLADRAKRDGLSNVHTVEGSLDDPLFPRKDLELVVLVHAFHDFSRPVEWLVNVKKYLRPGGEVAIIDLDPSQGNPAHFLARDRILARAASAGYGVARSVDDIPGYIVLLLRPQVER